MSSSLRPDEFKADARKVQLFSVSPHRDNLQNRHRDLDALVDALGTETFHQSDNSRKFFPVEYLMWNFTQSTHMSISSLHWGLASPPQRILTPTSWKSLSERSSTFSLHETESIAEART